MIELIQCSINDCPVAVNLGIRLAVEEGLPVQEHTYMQLLSEMSADILNGRRVVWLAVDSESVVGDTGEQSPAPTPRVVGVIQLKERIDPFFGKFYECGGFYVLPEYRNKKVGRRLLETALSSVSEDLPVMIVSSGELRRSYKRLGFKPVSTMCMAQISEIRQAVKSCP